MSGSVLVVDDNFVNLELARVTLQLAGLRVTGAIDGEQALAAVAAERPALILLDLQMPGMDGFEVARRLKSDPRTRGITIVAMTAYAMKGDEERARAAGCDGYIVKPIDVLALPKQVAAYMGGDQSAPS